MSIPNDIHQRFQGLIAAVLQNRLMLIACTNKTDGSTAYVLSVPDDEGNAHPWGEIKPGVWAMANYHEPDLEHVLAMAPTMVTDGEGKPVDSVTTRARKPQTKLSLVSSAGRPLRD